MIVQLLKELFERDLNKMIAEINSYQNEKQMWELRGDVLNSGGNLCLHIVGNLNHFIGATLGNTGYIRERDAEFNSKNIARQLIVTQLNQTIEMVKNTFDNLKDDDLAKIYPINKWEKEWTTLQLLLHLYSHLNYHLGQLNYHRRIV